jgi:hypothetical protein
VALVCKFDLAYTKGHGGEDEYPDRVERMGLLPFFNHSDCDGELTPEEAKGIADGLDVIIPLLPEPVYPWDSRHRAIQFRDGCRRAAAANEKMIFG